ncbi:ATPase (plasmid) [Microvirga ossetica]|uniref:histidine kinase n=2 Tax=Microvirga ossetica TaxID=1882682 RepID=A0A1B2EZC7_9HYPH|nr:ATPase [Microvirga ossetica]
MCFWRIAIPLRCFLALPVIAWLAMVPVLLASTGSRADAEPKRVLMLHSFGLRFKPWTDRAQVIREEISRRKSVDFQDHSLLNARLNDDKSEGPFVDYLRALYTSQPPDLIVAIGAPAANFVQRHRSDLFPNAPMVFTAVQQLRVDPDKLTDNDTVVAAADDYAPLFENILRVQPSTKLIAIVSGASPNEKFWQGVLRRVLEPFAGRVEIKWYNELSFEGILKDASNLPPHSAIFWQLMNVDAAGVVHEGGTALLRLSATANAPIFAYDDAFFGEAILGGPMASVVEGSKAAAAVALRILDGEKPGDIKTPPTPLASPKFDWRQVQRWGISESDLPPGSTVLFKPPTMWETYRWQILTACTVISLQALLIVLLLLERQRRYLAEVQSRQRMVELAHMNRQATAGQLSASIAHELNQPLGAILNNAEAATLIIDSPSPNLQEVKSIIEDIKRDDQRASEVIKRLRRLLTRGAFDSQEVDLNEVVGEVFRILSAQAAARDVRLDKKLTPHRLPVTGDRIQLQQVILNLVVNGIDAIADMPNGVREIACTSWASDGLAHVSIRDTGPGIPPDRLEQLFEPFFTTKPEGMGMGLCIAHTIIESHGGKISAETRSSGAVFYVSLPLAKTTRSSMQ